MSKFVTHSLDVAGYLFSQGYDCKIKRHGQHRCDFIYTDPDVEKKAVRFMRGEVVMNIQRYVYSRDQVKKRANTQPFEVVPSVTVSNKDKKFTLGLGDTYFFVAGGQVYSACYSTKKPHTDRVSEGNVYQTKEEAEKAL